MFLGIDPLFEVELRFNGIAANETGLFKPKSIHESSLPPDR
jgi:hypothetical protein